MTDSLKVWDLQKSIYRHLKKRAKAIEGEVSEELKRYEKNQRTYANRSFQTSNFSALLNSIKKSDVVFLGDFHSFNQNTRNLERLTRALIKQRKKFAIGIELAHQEHQSAIENYLKKAITELEFLEEINYHESWRFPWIYYRPFFEMARAYQLPIIALNTNGSLIQRDLKAAEQIKKFMKENPGERLLVLFGELHIVANKLPKMVKKELLNLIPDYEQTIIHQNLDEVYWKLHETDIENHNQIVSFKESEFSLQTAPPWIKYESMIYWYENLSDDPEFELHDYTLSDGVLGLHSNVPENFIFLCQKIAKSLGLEASNEELEDFNLYEHQNLKIMLDKIGRIPKSSVVQFHKNLVKEGRVFRIPFSNNFYCSSYSINRMTFLAGLHLQDIIIRKENINYESIWMEHSISKKFILIFKQTTFGFLSSKIVNPFRKCDRYCDFLDQIKLPDIDKRSKSILEVTIALIENQGERELKSILPKDRVYIVYEVARKLGFYLGDFIYESQLIKDKESYKGILKYLIDSNLEEAKFMDILTELLPSGAYQEHRKRYF